MFKRVGVMTAIPVILATLLSSLATGAVAAKPTRSATIDETSPCNFTVHYSYGSVGGGPDLMMSVILYRQEVGTTDWTVVGGESSGPVHGSGAANFEVHFADSGQTTAAQYFGYGYLHKGARTIRNSQAFTELTAPETCD
jgi:hypothetical protein